jgi:hypothetical protein
MPLVAIAFRKLLNLKPFLTWRRVFIVYVICSNWALVNAVTTALEENSSFYALALKLSAPGNLVHLVRKAFLSDSCPDRAPEPCRRSPTLFSAPRFSFAPSHSLASFPLQNLRFVLFRERSLTLD